MLILRRTLIQPLHKQLITLPREAKLRFGQMTPHHTKAAVYYTVSKDVEKDLARRELFMLCVDGMEIPDGCEYHISFHCYVAGKRTLMHLFSRILP